MANSTLAAIFVTRKNVKLSLRGRASAAVFKCCTAVRGTTLDVS